MSDDRWMPHSVRVEGERFDLFVPFRFQKKELHHDAKPVHSPSLSLCIGQQRRYVVPKRIPSVNTKECGGRAVNRIVTGQAKVISISSDAGKILWSLGEITGAGEHIHID